MSIVGTRPPTLDEWNKYELHHRARLAIKPGITGMWQVSGRSEITDFEEVVKLDTEYMSTIKDAVRVVCLSEVYDSMLMWSHYAQNHRFGLMFILARR